MTATLAFRLGRRSDARPGSLLAVLLTAASATAGDGAVWISCAQVPAERAAEVESRVRANLLTTPLPTAVEIACVVDRVEVRASRGRRSAEAQVSPSEATWRDDVLGAVDEALRRLAGDEANGAGEVETSEITPAPGPPVAQAPAVAAPATPSAPPAPEAAPPSLPLPITPRDPARAAFELSAVLRGELWREGAAGGGALCAVRRATRFGYGGCAGLLRPLARDRAFDLNELSASLGVSYEPSFAAGVRLTVGAGASLMLVSPSVPVISLGDTTSFAPFLDAELSRAFWLHRFALQPALGLRGFSNERGVRLDGRGRLSLGGVVPRAALWLVYRAN